MVPLSIICLTSFLFKEFVAFLFNFRNKIELSTTIQLSLSRKSTIQILHYKLILYLNCYALLRLIHHLYTRFYNYAMLEVRYNKSLGVHVAC